MRIGFFLIALLYIPACHSKKRAEANLSAFELFVRQIFFNAPVEDKNEDLIAYYSGKQNLRSGGYTSYPPLSALGEDDATYPFFFRKHEFLPACFNNGIISVRASRRKNKWITERLRIEFQFDDKMTWQKGIDYMQDRFKKFQMHADVDPEIPFFEISDTASKKIRSVSLFYFHSTAYEKPYVLFVEIPQKN